MILKLSKALEVQKLQTVQQNLFEDTAETFISIQDAADILMVSKATIRNWIKAGNILQASNGLIIKKSLIDFKSNTGAKKLIARSNKSLKDWHNHASVTSFVRKKADSEYSDFDFLSMEYESSLSESYRNKEGIYYTPEHIIDNLFDIQGVEIDSAKFCDPCCGSGNFLLHALKLGFRPENIYGFDTDFNAIEIAKNDFILQQV